MREAYLGFGIVFAIFELIGFFHDNDLLMLSMGPPAIILILLYSSEVKKDSEAKT